MVCVNDGKVLAFVVKTGTNVGNDNRLFVVNSGAVTFV